MSTHDDFREDAEPEKEEGVLEDPVQPIETTENYGFTGSAVASSSGSYGMGGIYTSPPFAPTYPSTTTYPITTTTAATPAKALGKVSLPPKFTQKVLVAFMEGEEDDIVWAKKLQAENISIESDGQIILTLRLEDFYDNED